MASPQVSSWRQGSALMVYPGLPGGFTRRSIVTESLIGGRSSANTPFEPDLVCVDSAAGGAERATSVKLTPGTGWPFSASTIDPTTAM